MIPTFSARRRAEEFASAVDDGATPRSDEATTLLELVSSLRDVEPVAPRAEFADDLRSRLMTEAQTVLKPETANLLLPARTPAKRERRLVAAAAAFVLVGGTTTVAAAAQGALPGETLYPIKRGLEQADAQLSTSPAGKGRDLLDQASRRLDEVSGLAGGDPVAAESRIPETLEAFSATAGEGAQLLFTSFQEDADPEAVVSVRTFTAHGIRTLEGLAGAVPADSQDELADAAMLLQELDQEASALCGSCAAELPAVEVPGIFLARAEADRALAQAAGQELTNDHPVVVPRDAVRRAQREADDAGPAPDGGAQAPVEQPAVPGPTLPPDALGSLLPDLGQKSADGGKADPGEPVKKLTEDLQKSLGGVVETLLPAPDGGSLLDSDDGSLLGGTGDSLLDSDGGSLLD
jgi:hypothetical protein